ncbi:hypothetical protein GIB67_028095 [Kingdonia uniflora]|uniref:No apical meristem-associated C-terminal domain-containing protein n=1 Tax=Kingdonia uniflora TaxID=39325 RepID=A0A7J7NRG1_9MAGN|nr:hypothetical protein GIB67_028095 [Kingdonia uniflora]
MANFDTSSNHSTSSTPSSQNPPSTLFAQHPSSQFTPYLYQNTSQFQPQFQSQTPPLLNMSQGDPSYGQYQGHLHYLNRNLRRLARIINHIRSLNLKENDARKIYKDLNGDNDFKHREAYKILVREPRWANLRDDGLNHAVNIPRNMVRRTSGNSSPGNSVGSNNLLEDPDGPTTPQSAGLNSDLDGSLYEGGSRPIGKKLYKKNIISQKAMKGVTVSGSGVHALLDELRLEKIQTKEEKERRRVEAMQHWQAKMDLEQAKEDRKIMDKDLSTLSGHQLLYYLQRQAEIMECLANKGEKGT